ncbi:MAG: hypothetical protein ACI4NI_11655 [Candidatus Ornithospirochaeta sp.]
MEVVGSIPAAPIGSKAISDKEIAFFIALDFSTQMGIKALCVNKNIN